MSCHYNLVKVELFQDGTDIGAAVGGVVTAAILVVYLRLQSQILAVPKSASMD